MVSSPLPLPTPLVDAAWVAQRLDHPNLVIVDCRFALGDPTLGRQQYTASHLPGAVYGDLNQDLSSPPQGHGGRHPLPPWPDFVHTLESWGISSQPPTAVVAYDDSRGAFAARLWWLLRYLGHPAVAVLQGGFSGWQGAGLPTTAAGPTPPRGQFQPQPQPGWVVTQAEVERLRQQPGVALVDARSPQRYRGEEEPIDPIPGSIPGAVNYFWQQVVDDQGIFQSPEQLRTHWQALGDQSLVMYCGSGVTACVNLLSRVAAGYAMDPLYVGGWSDWCSYLQGPGA